MPTRLTFADARKPVVTIILPNRLKRRYYYNACHNISGGSSMDSFGNSDIRIDIDQELAPVVPEYLENRRLDCLLIERLLAENNLAEIKLLAHRMKGSGGSYGFDEISEIGEMLECVTLVSDADGIRSAIAQLRQYLSRVSVTYI
jgi:HPt (histidine-containing phosphotransfer) domain-containing protein